MKIWVDADACPNAVKDVLYMAADRVDVELTLVANQRLRTPGFGKISSVQVSGGFNVADDYILEHAEAGDLVITADIPLAAEVIAKGAHAINPRGTEYDADNVRQVLGMRNFMEEMRGAGQVTGGLPPLSKRELQTFTNALDRFLTLSLREL